MALTTQTVGLVTFPTTITYATAAEGNTHHALHSTALGFLLDLISDFTSLSATRHSLTSPSVPTRTMDVSSVSTATVHFQMAILALDRYDVPETTCDLMQVQAPGCWVTGLRNGWRASWDLQSNPPKFYIGEVGGNVQAISTEDVHVLTTTSGGDDLGWPACEGKCNNPDFPSCNCQQFDDPVFTYSHKGEGAAITGGVVYRGTSFPAEYRGAYFYGDYTRDFIHVSGSCVQLVLL